MNSIRRGASGPTLALYKVLLQSYYYSGAAWTHRSLGRGSQHCVVLLYHGVTSIGQSGTNVTRSLLTPLDEFKWQMGYLKRHFSPMPLSQVISCMKGNKPFPSRAAVVTFDDGYQNVLTEALPVLRNLSIPFTLFAASELVGCTDGTWWDCLDGIVEHSASKGKVELALDASPRYFDLSKGEGRSALYRQAQDIILSAPDRKTEILGYLEGELGGAKNVDSKRAMLDWPGLRELASTPLVEIGSHSVSHPNLARLVVEEARIEIFDSKRILENKLGISVTSFAYPFGQPDTFNDNTVSLVQEAGYMCGVTGIEGTLNYNADLFQLSRIPVQGDDSRAVFVAKVLGISGLLRSIWRRFLRTQQ